MFGLLRPTIGADARRLPKSYMTIYCDVCATLSLRYGIKARPLIVHDIVSLGWLLAEPEGPPATFPRGNCVRGGVRSVPPAVRDPADRTHLLAALSCYAVGVKLDDDIRDRPSWHARLLNNLYATTFEQANHELSRRKFPLSGMEESLGEQQQVERQGSSDLETASGPTGRAYGLVGRRLAQMAPETVSADLACQLGEILGRCVYVIDAYRDADADRGVSYNPLCCDTSSTAASFNGRRVEARAYVDAQLRSADVLLNGADQRAQIRWSMLAQRLRRYIGLGTTAVTLNAVICLPCGDGAVAVDDKECTNTICGCCCAGVLLVSCCENGCCTRCCC